jgi:excisionase family DNA binding protein
MTEVIVMAQNSSLQSPPLFEKEIMRVSHVAELLGYTTWHIYRLVNQNRIPFKKKGKTLFFLRQELLDWIQEGDQ